MARAEKQMETASEEIVKLWASVGRVRIRVPAGQQLAVTRDGVEVDFTRDVLVNAGRDELVFTRKDGSEERVTVEVAAGATIKLDAPKEQVARPAPPRPPKVEPPKPPKQEVTVKPAEPAKPVAPAPIKPAPPAEPEEAEAEEAEGEAAEAEAPAEAEPEAPAAGLRYDEGVGLGLIAGAVVAGGLAGGFAYVSGRDHDRSRELGCSPDGQCPFGPAADAADRSNDRARIAQISAIGGGALLATGVALWFYGRGKARRAATDVTLRVESTSVAFGWRF
jgi:hypothetical protein